MKKIATLIFAVMTCFLLCHCSDVVSTTNQGNEIAKVQELCREAQNAWESGDIKTTRNKISEMVSLSEDSMYTKKERLTAKYAAVYINAGVNLDYIMKNDKEWCNQQDLSDFSVFHEFIFTEIMNGNIHEEEINGYINALVECTRPIYEKYTSLTQ